MPELTPAQPTATPLPPTLTQRLGGLFLAFEGPDGCGKSTQLRRFVESAKASLLTVCEVREPGGTPIGEEIRKVLLHTKEDMSLRCELLLYMASRNQLVEQRIKPALAAGQLVIADRFISSTYAYQGAAAGIPKAEIDAVAGVTLQGCQPDLVILFDVDTETALRRTRGIEKVGKKKVAPATVSLFDDRIEQRGNTFHSKVRDSYLDQAKSDPARHVVIDARKDPESVWNDFLAALTKRLA